MAVAYNQGYTLTRNDLNIILTDTDGNRVNATEIYYAIYYVDTSGGFPGVEVLVGDPQRTPVNPSVGEYYAAFEVPIGAQPGLYRIRWFFRQYVDSDLVEVVQEFQVLNAQEGCGCPTPIYSCCIQDLIGRLRIHLRDQNPDRNYHFVPPTQEGVVGKFNRVFGQIWEDYELVVYLQGALETWNSMPPETEEIYDLDQLCLQKPTWKMSILWGAIQLALLALSINWIHDEFSLDGSTLVRVYLPDGKEIDVSMEDLYSILHEEG